MLPQSIGGPVNIQASFMLLVRRSREHAEPSDLQTLHHGLRGFNSITGYQNNSVEVPCSSHQSETGQGFDQTSTKFVHSCVSQAKSNKFKHNLFST